MSKEGTMLNGKNKEEEINLIKEKVSGPEFQRELNLFGKKQYSKYSILKKVAIAAAGIGISTAMMSFLSKGDGLPSSFNEDETPNTSEDIESVSDTLPLSSKVLDEMNFKEAFSAARLELGAGGIFEWNNNIYNTYFKEEWQEMGEANQKIFADKINNWKAENITIEDKQILEPVLMYEVAPIIESVDDEMTLNDAFSVARSEVGPGGIFQWNGNYYNTFYEEELEKMTELEQAHFDNSVLKTSIDIRIIQPSVIPRPENVEPSYPLPIREILINKGEFIASDEIEGVRVDLFDYDGQILGKMDFDLDGKYEYVYYPDTGEIVNLMNGRAVDIFQLLDEGIPSVGYGGGDVVPIEVQIAIIDGHETEVTIFSDGHIEANIDLDNDGIHDSLVDIDNQGNWEVQYQDGEVLCKGAFEFNPFNEETLTIEDKVDATDEDALDIDPDHLVSDENHQEDTSVFIDSEGIDEIDDEIIQPILEIGSLTHSDIIQDVPKENTTPSEEELNGNEMEFDIKANVEPDSIHAEFQNFAEESEGLNQLENDEFNENIDLTSDLDSDIYPSDFDLI